MVDGIGDLLGTELGSLEAGMAWWMAVVTCLEPNWDHSKETGICTVDGVGELLGPHWDLSKETGMAWWMALVTCLDPNRDHLKETGMAW